MNGELPSNAGFEDKFIDCILRQERVSEKIEARGSRCVCG
jgi:hypothetical protein